MPIKMMMISILAGFDGNIQSAMKALEKKENNGGAGFKETDLQNSSITPIPDTSPTCGGVKSNRLGQLLRSAQENHHNEQDD